MIRRHPRASVAPARAGFSLIEILAVIVILGILFAFIVPNLLSANDTVKGKTTRTFLDQLTSEIENYERTKGKYPGSTFAKALDPKPSKTNMGIESLVIALMPADGSYKVSASFDDRLCNSDADNTKTSHTRFPIADAFEFEDAWGNPIAYLHRKDYKKGAEYLTFSDAMGDDVEEKVIGEVNPQTGAPYRQDSFQLISAGADGIFGTEDDIGNFNRN